MTKFLFAPIIALLISGCAGEIDGNYTTTTPALQPNCIIVSDDYGEREVCNAQYYYVNGGVVYWDAHFNTWIGHGRYWWHGGWYNGFYPGYREYYHGYYHPHGFYHGGFRGNGGWHGGGGGHFNSRGGGHSGGGHGGGHR